MSHSDQQNAVFAEFYGAAIGDPWGQASGKLKPGLVRALELVNHIRNVHKPMGLVGPAPGVLAVLDRVISSLTAELLHGPSTSELMQ